MRWEATAKVNRDITLANTSFDQARQVVNSQPKNYAATRDDLALQYARLPPEKGAEAWMGARQRLAYDASLGALRANPNAVNEALKKEPGKSGIPYIDDLGADERLQLQAKTETELEQIKREQERVRAERKAALNSRRQNQIALAEVGLMPETLISRAEFVAAGIGDEYNDYSQAMRLVPLMNSLANMNRADALAEIESASASRSQQARLHGSCWQANSSTAQGALSLGNRCIHRPCQRLQTQRERCPSQALTQLQIMLFDSVSDY